MPSLAVRPVTSDDREFLQRVYAGTRAEELARTGWDEAQCAAFVAMQFEAQDRHYRQHFPRADYGVIEWAEAGAPVPVGRLWIDRRPDAIHVLDISLLPEHRGRGLGTQCLRRLMAEARARGAALTIQVEQFNPARSLYERLGFVPQGLQGMHIQMAWRADAAIQTKETEDEQA
jgi:ribosomal protein S18 acetylase RimI-like enzyme